MLRNSLARKVEFLPLARFIRQYCPFYTFFFQDSSDFFFSEIKIRAIITLLSNFQTIIIYK